MGSFVKDFKISKFIIIHVTEPLKVTKLSEKQHIEIYYITVKNSV